MRVMIRSCMALSIAGLLGRWVRLRGVGEQLAQAVEQASQLQPLLVWVRQPARLWENKTSKIPLGSSTPESAAELAEGGMSRLDSTEVAAGLAGLWLLQGGASYLGGLEGVLGQAHLARRGGALLPQQRRLILPERVQSRQRL
jgi:hypothetical protein